MYVHPCPGCYVPRQMQNKHLCSCPLAYGAVKFSRLDFLPGAVVLLVVPQDVARVEIVVVHHIRSQQHLVGNAAEKGDTTASFKDVVLF